MTPRHFLALLLVTALPLAAAIPDDIVQPAYRFTPGESDAAWHDLLDQLHAAPPLRAQFEERRFFPFRQGYASLTGVIRLDPDHGLSLQYVEPKAQLMVVDARGGFMADHRGRRRELPDDRRARAATGALLHVLRFNLPLLAQDFAIYAAREGAQWKFTFIPKPGGDLAEALNPVRVSGEGTYVRLIEMRKTEHQRIEIHVGETETGVTFTPGELAKYFR